ncbi:MAG: hypothetical protein NVS1B7_4670 [Candidatus Saccharimonadales bacterium]
MLLKNKVRFFNKLLLISLTLLAVTIPYATILTSVGSASTLLSVNNWWPVNNSVVSGTQPFKGVLDGWSVSDYTMGWSVDNGLFNEMPTDYNGFPHKEVPVNLSNWNWQASGQYGVTYVAKNKFGMELARTTFTIIVNPSVSPITLSIPNSTPLIPIPTNSSTSPATITPTNLGFITSPTPLIVKAINSYALFVNPSTPAQRTADAWRLNRPNDAKLLDKIAQRAGAVWFGGWNSNIETDINAIVSAAYNIKALPVLVLYNIPGRDCASYSAGGTSSAEYIPWINSVNRGIGGRPALVIVEPDSLANIDCLQPQDQLTRLSLLSDAVRILKTNPNSFVYLDAGHPGWQTAAIIAERLRASNIAEADGFSLNVSNFIGTSENYNYGKQISSQVGNKHFVIDTSRNGLGPASDFQWCNPSGRALGDSPATLSNSLVDAYLWIKAPGESDGNCNGGPPAGSWWPEYALGLAERANY